MGIGYATHLFGLSYAFGAFVAGDLLAVMGDAQQLAAFRALVEPERKWVGWCKYCQILI